MSQSETIKISHPYFASVTHAQGAFVVILSEAFPLAFRQFVLQPGADAWDGSKGLESNFGFVEDDGHVFWLSGYGGSYQEAVHDALSMFINWVVHPADVGAGHFRLREIA